MKFTIPGAAPWIVRSKTRTLLFALALGGCQITSTWDKAPEYTDAGEAAFGTIGGASTGGSSGFGDRRGATVPWADTVSSAAVPTGALTHVGRLPGRALGNGPDLVFGDAGIGILGGNSPGTLAVDLATMNIKWTATVILVSGQLATDGTLVCGYVSPTSLACLDAATGATKWQVTTTLAPSAYSQPDLVLRDGRLTIAVDRSVAVFDLATGAKRWSGTGAADGRLLVFVGDALVLGNVAVDPATGAQKSKSSEQTGDYLWQANGKAYFTNGYSPKAVSYDSATHAWADATGELSTFFAGWLGGRTNPNPQPRVLTEPDADGTLYADVQQFSTGGGGSLCKWNATTQATAWCVDANAAVKQFRAHPNRLFVDGTVLDAATGQPANAETHRLFFGHFAFNGDEVFGVN